MLSWLGSNRAYDQITGITLGIGFFATLVMTYLPELTSIAVVVMISATLVAMVVYFLARCRSVQEKAPVNRPEEAVERNSLESEAARQGARDHEAVSDEKPTTEERAPIRPIRQIQGRPWAELHKDFPLTMTPEAYREAIDILRRISELSVGHTWNRQLQHNLRKSIFTFDIREIARELDRDRSEELARNIYWSAYSGSTVRSHHFLRSKEAIKPITVKIGPVTVEITDDETRVNVESLKPVVTNVSAPERVTADPGRESRNTEKSPRRTVH